MQTNEADRIFCRYPQMAWRWFVGQRCVSNSVSLNPLHSWMHVHKLYALYVSVHKYWHTHKTTSLVLNDQWQGSYTRHGTGHEKGWVFEKIVIRNCPCAIIIHIRIDNLNISGSVSVCTHSQWPAIDCMSRAAITNTDPALQTPAASEERWDTHKAINSQIKIPSTCHPIQWSVLSVNE